MSKDCCDDCKDGKKFCWGRIWQLHGNHLIIASVTYLSAVSLQIREPWKITGMVVAGDFIKHHVIDGMPIM